MPPHHFQNPYATPQKYEILMPPLLMPPPKILMPPVYATHRGGIKKGGVALKKKPMPLGGGLIIGMKIECSRSIMI